MAVAVPAERLNFRCQVRVVPVRPAHRRPQIVDHHRVRNHWFDCIVGCAAAASCENIAPPGAEAARSSRARKRYTQADLKRS